MFCRKQEADLATDVAGPGAAVGGQVASIISTPVGLAQFCDVFPVGHQPAP